MRRRLLLAIVNAFKWLVHSFEYLYYSLIPQTISGKNVRNKAKFTKIYGNSEVVNQLVATSDVRPLTTTTTNGITFTNNNDGSITISGTASADFYQQITRDIPISMQGHSWLIFSELLGDSSKYWLTDGWTGAVINDGNAKIQVVNTSYVVLRFNIKSGVQINQTIHPQLVDLTKAYPFDTPTTLTDNRVKNILAQGYIPYNTGEIKDMVIGEIGSEGYNLFDEELAVGFWNGSVGSQISTDNYSSDIRCVNKIKVIGGETYVLEWDNTTYPNLIPYFVETDENGIVLKRANGNTGTFYTREMLSNTKYAYIYFYWINHTFTTPPTDLKCCVHRQGTRTGYAPYKAPSTLQLPATYKSSGIGTSKDSWEITNTSHIFTRNNFEVELGGLNWTYESLGSGDNYYSDIISNAVKYSVVLCDKYTCDMSVSPATLRNNVWISQSGRINITADGYSGNANNFKTAMSGVMLKYQLATPQVITIPRKHLAVVDLGGLTFGEQGGGFSSTEQIAKYIGSTSQLSNIYCSKYLTMSLVGLTNGSLGISVLGNGSIWIKDNDLTLSNINEKLSGQYLFYETENEVADITDTFDIEAGGNVNGNLFSWVRNQLAIIPTLTSRNVNGIDYVNNNDGSITISGTASAETTIDLSGNLTRNVPFGHKVFITNFKTPSNTTYYLYDAYESGLNATQFNQSYGYIKEKAGSSTIISPRIRVFSGTNIATPQTIKIIYVDLTLAFGAGNEPTDINDYRIQYILEHGYIPTDINGTYTNETCEVLPDIDLTMKCK